MNKEFDQALDESLKYFKAKKHLRGDELHEKILQVTLKLMLKNGIENTNLSQIADKCGITRRTLYAHFPNKEALILTVMLSTAKNVIEKFSPDYSSCTNATERLEQWMQEFIRINLKNPKFTKFFKMFRHYARKHNLFNDPTFQKITEGLEDNVYKEIKEIFFDGADSGEFSFSREEYKMPMMIIFNALNGYLDTLMFRRNFYEFDRAKEQKDIDNLINYIIKVVK